MKLSLIIILCLVFVFSACSGGDTAVANTTNNADETIETVIEETTATPYNAHLPDMDFDGTDIRILNMDVESMWWTLVQLDSEKEDGDVINDAIYKRNLTIEEKYNLNINEIRIPAGNIISSVSNSVQAGSDDYDLVTPHSYNINSLAQQGMLYDMKSLPYIDFDKPWWGNSGTDFSISGKVYFAISDFLLSDKENVAIMMYNKKIADDLGLATDTELYNLVNDGKWTLDVFLQMVESASADLNGNGTPDVDDRYGLMTADWWSYPSLMALSGEQFVTKDANDIPKFTANNERFINVYDKILSFMDNRNLVVRQYIEFAKNFNRDEWGIMFTNDKALFCNEVLSCVRLYKEMESDFAVVPMPKFDDKQEKYYSYSVWATAMGIPLTVKEPDKVAFAVEALSALSRESVIPAYYEVAIAVKYLRDDMSFKMLDIIIENKITDILHVVYDWGGFDTTFKNYAADGKTDLVSLFEQNESKINSAIEKTIETYQQIQ